GGHEVSAKAVGGAPLVSALCDGTRGGDDNVINGARCECEAGRRKGENAAGCRIRTGQTSQKGHWGTIPGAGIYRGGKSAGTPNARIHEQLDGIQNVASGISSCTKRLASQESIPTAPFPTGACPRLER